LACLVTVVLGSVTFAACGGDGGAGSSGGGGSGGERIEMAYLTKMGTNPYFVQEIKGAKREAKKLGVDLTVQDLQLDADAALSALDTVIGQGAQGIAIVVPDQKIGPSVIQKAQAQDVPLMAADDTIEGPDGDPAPFVGFDWPAVGRQVGAEMAKRFKEAGWDPASTKIASIELQELSVCMVRNRNAQAEFLDQVPDFPEENIVHVPYDGTSNTAIDAMNGTITANQRVEHWLIWSCNDDGVVGAIRALENAGIGPDRAIGVGLNANLACGEWKKGGDTALKSAIYTDSAKVGAGAVEALYEHIKNGEPLPKKVLFKGVLVTPQDYKQKMEGYVGC